MFVTDERAPVAALERVLLMWKHLMAQIRVSAPAGRRYAPLVVNQTTARSLPSQQTQERGQMIPHEKDTL